MKAIAKFNDMPFTTIMADIDGNNYKTILVGNQLWLGENLKTTKLKDGSAIPIVSNNSEWIDLTTPGY